MQVHERTHRNDRPFECNICHQKFYRKEPMQKHQWRQHGIVHSKSRPLPAVPASAPALATALPTPVVENDPEEAQDFSIPAVAARQHEQEPNAPFPEPPMAHSSERASSSNVRFQFSKLSEKYDPSLYQTESNLVPPRAHANSCANPALKQEENLSALNYSQVPKLPSPPQPVPEDASVDSEFKNAKHLVRREDGSEEDIAAIRLPEIISKSLQFSTTSKETTSAAEDDIHRQPMKLKMKLAQAYQREMLEFRDKEQEREESGRQLGGPNVMQTLDSNMSGMNLQSASPSPDPEPVLKETVECQCKSCGNAFFVLDPYNFRCNNCNVKYTSVPTHLIADPLQCIGCCQVFPHKPALKAHQTRSEKERPFRCCKCGYGFRQKAHLQKHQWRIHRRKLESDQSVKEAEAFFQAIKDDQKPDDSDPDVKKVTIQDIINHRVEHSMRSDQAGQAPGNKTSSKYFSHVLGLEFQQQGPSAEKYLKTERSSAIANDSEDSNEEIQMRKSPRKDQQPLDLSPTKSVTSRRSDSPSVDRKLHQLIGSVPFNDQDGEPSFAGTMSPAKLVQRENNPLLNQAPGAGGMDADLALIVAPTLKKLKTDSTSHKSLPPISGLQRPSSFNLSKEVKKEDAPMSKHDSMSKNLLLPSDVVRANGGGDLMRNQLLGGPCNNARTV